MSDEYSPAPPLAPAPDTPSLYPYEEVLRLGKAFALAALGSTVEDVDDVADDIAQSIGSDLAEGVAIFKPHLPLAVNVYNAVQYRVANDRQTARRHGPLHQASQNERP